MKSTNSSARLKEAMELRGYRQSDIIAKCRPYERTTGTKIYSSILSQYLSGEREIGRDKLIVLAQVLNVSESWLAGYDVPMDRSHDLQASERAAILADISEDTDLIDRIQKIQKLSVPDKAKVYGYIDAVYELSVSDEDLDE